MASSHCKQQQKYKRFPWTEKEEMLSTAAGILITLILQFELDIGIF